MVVVNCASEKAREKIICRVGLTRPKKFGGGAGRHRTKK